MADEAREYLRAAQEAEIRGDVKEAVELLRKAATLYKSRGNTSRALQMLRHARRLDGTRQDVLDEIGRLEWLPDDPLSRAVAGNEVSVDPSDELKAELDKLLTPTEQPLPGATEKQLFERGPAKADPSLNAWCSFCCKPRNEVGELVAGPAGAFICAGCLFEGARLLAVPLAPKSSVSVQPPLEPDEIAGGAMAAVAKATAKLRHATPAVTFFSQPVAARMVEQSLIRGARLVLVTGPEGTGKSAYLQDLERRGVGTRGSVRDAAKVLLLDGFDQLPEAERAFFAERFLDEPGLRAVISVRADAPLEPLTLLSDDGPFILHPTASIIASLGGVVPSALADRVDAVAVFEPLSDAELKELAQKFAEQRASDLDLSEDVLNALVQLSARSGRGGRELEALLRRIPPGSWGLAPGAGASKSKRSRKK